MKEAKREEKSVMHLLRPTLRVSPRCSSHHTHAFLIAHNGMSLPAGTEEDGDGVFECGASVYVSGKASNRWIITAYGLEKISK